MAISIKRDDWDYISNPWFFQLKPLSVRKKNHARDILVAYDVADDQDIVDAFEEMIVDGIFEEDEALDEALMDEEGNYDPRKIRSLMQKMGFISSFERPDDEEEIDPDDDLDL